MMNVGDHQMTGWAKHSGELGHHRFEGGNMGQRQRTNDDIDRCGT
jgi:hypothetical protein